MTEREITAWKMGRINNKKQQQKTRIYLPFFAFLQEKYVFAPNDYPRHEEQKERKREKTICQKSYCV